MSGGGSAEDSTFQYVPPPMASTNGGAGTGGGEGSAGTPAPRSVSPSHLSGGGNSHRTWPQQAAPLSARRGGAATNGSAGKAAVMPKNMPPEQLAKLRERNKLLDVLENLGQQIVVVGDTSSGKSTTINFILGFPFNFVAQGVGTRRPCVMTLTPDAGRSELMFRVTFQKNDYVFEQDLTSLPEVARLVKGVNDPRDHPEWFDCLHLQQGTPMRPEDAFDDTPIFVQLFHQDIECPMRLVDVPGLTRGNRLPTQIALSYINPDNAVVLVIGKDHPNNGGFPHLAQAMRQCAQTIFVQNFASTKIQDNQVMENYQVICEKMQTNNLTLYCVDYGIPYEPGLSLWQEGLDQKDWLMINKQEGVEGVRVAMVNHADMRAEQLVERFDRTGIFRGTHLVPGLAPVRQKLNDFQFQDVDNHILHLKEEVRKQIAKRKEELQKAESRVKQLQHPPEWDGMLSAFAACTRKYLDSTFPATEAPETKDGCNNVLWCTEEEVKRVTSNGKSEEGGDGFHWFSKDVDKAIVDLMAEYCDFEAPLAIAGIRSWQRLVDEFTGMVTFAPMPCVSASTHDMAKMRVGGGQSGQLNYTEEVVALVVSLELGGGRSLVRPLLEQFERRMRLLVERDYTNALAAVERNCQVELRNFFNLVVDAEAEELADNRANRTEEIRKVLMAGMLKALLDHAGDTLVSTLQGEMERDMHGEPITEAVTQRTRMKERSGMMIRVNENSPSPGPLHWMLPFKFNNFSGQIALRSLQCHELPRGGPGRAPLRRGRCVGAIVGGCCEKQQPELDESPDKPWSRTLADEVGLKIEQGPPTINCCNAVNLRIFRLCTEDYEVPVSVSAAPVHYDIETLKLLKALQFELAAAWAAMWRGMLQEVTNREKAGEFVHKQLGHANHGGMYGGSTPTAKAAGLDALWPQLPPQHEKEPILEAVVSVMGWLSGSRANPGDMMTTEEEVQKSGESAKWPEFQGYLDFLRKLDPKKAKTAFLSNRNTKLAGQPSWLRLCDEFVFVILQLQMKRVSLQELSMAKASAGLMSAASQQEVIAKLALHRMSQLNIHSQSVFRKRFDFLFQRDIKAGIESLHNVAHGLREARIGGLPATEWLQQVLVRYKDMVIDATLDALQAKFEGLQPFDFAMLNGRFPLNSSKMRKQHFDLQDDGKTVKQRNALSDIKQMWSMPRYATKQHTEIIGDKVMQLSPQDTVMAYENLQEQRERVEQIFNLDCIDPPAAGYAGGPFQELCLKFFKGLHVDAIHYCRPRLKAMMARLYQEDQLRRALQESNALDYLKDFGGHILERQRVRVDSLKSKVRTMEAALVAQAA